MYKIKPIVIFSVITATSIAAIGGAAAATPTISKAYSANTSLAAGSIVRLVPGAKDTVANANSSNAKSLIGVTEPSNGSLVAINPSNTTVQVAISGTAETLVSTVNGNIKQGDYVAVSPFGGMGMESSEGDYVIGIAESNFNANSPGAKEQTVTNNSGRATNVWAGEIPVTIAVGTDNGQTGNSKLNSLQQFARSLTGHTISTGRVIAALIVTVLAFATIVTLTYSATYGSIVSIGRNPLAKAEIERSLRSIVLVLSLITIVSGVLIYLLLS